MLLKATICVQVGCLVFILNFFYLVTFLKPPPIGRIKGISSQIRVGSKATRVRSGLVPPRNQDASSLNCWVLSRPFKDQVLISSHALLSSFRLLIVIVMTTRDNKEKTNLKNGMEPEEGHGGIA